MTILFHIFLIFNVEIYYYRKKIIEKSIINLWSVIENFILIKKKNPKN